MNEDHEGYCLQWFFSYEDKTKNKVGNKVTIFHIESDMIGTNTKLTELIMKYWDVKEVEMSVGFIKLIESSRGVMKLYQLSDG